MSTFGIDGLSSGLDTTSIISQLMKLEAAPQTLLKAKQSTTQSIAAALQAINVKTKSLGEVAAKAASADNWTSYKATSSSSAAKASTTTSATAGTLTFSVDAVATKQVSLTDAVTTGAGLTTDNPPTLTLKTAQNTYVSVTAASNSLGDIAKAINDSDMGIKATTVQVSGGATPTYRLQFTSETTGADGAFELFVGDEAAVIAATADPLATSVVTTPADASITLWKGSAYEQTYTQSSNTFAGVMTGVDVTVSKATEAGETVTINVAPDAAAVKSLASNLVNAIGVVFSDIASRTKATTTTKSDGTTAVAGGLLSGDSAVRSLQNQLTQAASYPVDGKSPSTVGIVVGRDGTFTFDEDVFAAALADDPDGTALFVQKLAERVQGVAENQSDAQTGALTLKITGQESLAKDYADRISAWDDRLAVRQETLQAQYTALEVALSGLNAQSSWLSGQLESLSANWQS
ncbi:flagellar filament capping protein FliD [Demequina sp. TTPB684]|uniref:flagellar filament capping protein FliD n=1 Tax=unclassified Demequina TaxID=2620311 RepID=UPI001CF50C09|nr:MULTISPECIES: flagellar filament capping protein FliD [unclassified Demequina]MCB2411966.1 flagellar filament capping protein FliD [Demequina sp. TTPB684]UPU87902.1 flagellar filament capping protein FliD [Demequina sp. TMPB413]